jgi:hypothetical protein
MPWNETGKVIVHKGFGNSIIHSGEFYPGREVDANGDYLPTEPAKQQEAPAQGASVSAKLDPKDWPDRSALEAMKAVDLKAWARIQGLQFATNTPKEEVLDLIDASRTLAPAGDHPNLGGESA